MKRGTWYFVYSHVNEFEGLGGTMEHEAIPLDVATEDEAVTEAKVKWIGLVEEAKKIFKDKKERWRYPPRTAFDNGPFHPHVIYKILL